jgi:hypothetical protein
MSSGRTRFFFKAAMKPAEAGSVAEQASDPQPPSPKAPERLRNRSQTDVLEKAGTIETKPAQTKPQCERICREVAWPGGRGDAPVIFAAIGQSPAMVGHRSQNY